MFTWLYLFFFNTLWVWVPFWIIWDAYGIIVGAVDSQAKGTGVKKAL